MVIDGEERGLGIRGSGRYESEDGIEVVGERFVL